MTAPHFARALAARIRGRARIRGSRVRRYVLVAVLIGASTSAYAQAPAQPPPPPPASPDSPPTPPPNYTYSAEGRRDPFVSLINRGATDPRSTRTGPTVRTEGLPGIMVDEVVVRGIMQTRGGWVAMIGAPNGRTYTARPGDKLMDGSIRTISPQVVILMQEVNDPLSLEKQREVRKYLRGEVK